MLHQAETPFGSERLPAPAPAKQVPEPAKKPVSPSVDEMRDEFLLNAQPVVDALRKSGKTREASQLEEAAKVIGATVGTRPTHLSTVGDSLKGESVSKVLKNIWEVIEKDPVLKCMPQARSLRKAGDALDGAGLLDITVRNGVVVSFVSNFTENYALAQQTAPKSTEKVVARPPLATPAPIPSAADLQPTPAVQARVASLLSPAVRAKVQALAEENLATRSAATGATSNPPAPVAPSVAPKAFVREDIPFELLAKMGVQAAELERTGQLQKLLEGKKTDLVSTFSLRNQQGEPIPFAAKMVLQRDAEGTASLQFDLPKHRLEIPEQIMGKQITPAMKEQLEQTGVVLTDGLKDSQGQTFAAYIAIDKEMNKVVALRQGNQRVPQVINGLTLKPEQQQQLLEGKPVRLEGMVTGDGKARFDATMQLDPFKRSINPKNERFYPAPQQAVTEQKEEQVSRPRMRI
ncbi:DUF3945 domain-containing protein [Hymenobacter volaticus]|uniref:DUF3945 domain-containing protein n=1 Tax=Hymenobacter volaticus TaxID=2932254 RepID=A0ABY4GER9_9BACT|nr:DUF3945 domain-containing protein [Hymenobacter volaticus]UOQ69432.1 DUF3945 domain-containing protein [Hymenobacter volaticus]